MLSRRCTKATTLNGIDIPVGTIIAPDVYSLNFDPKHWGRVHPNEFYPLRQNKFQLINYKQSIIKTFFIRFSPDYDRNKNAYLSFGYGPMHCLGKI
jgi:cytochrome P450